MTGASTAPVVSPRDDALAAGELMEEAGQEESVLRGALTHVEWVTRWGGAFGSLRAALRKASDLGVNGCRAPSGVRGPGTARRRLLDVGAGSGRVARALAESVSGDDLTWSAFGVDNHAGIARIAAEATPPGQPGPVRGDARALPFPDASFDAVLCNLTLHHFGQAEAIQIVREMARVSNGLVLIADLERRRAALLGARLLARTLWSRNPLVRHDGPVSVMRGFTPVELHEIAVKAGLVRARVRRVPVFRLLMTATVDPTRRV